jgi:hypothetical protein
MKKIIGHVPVDSGQVIIVDPCYLSGWVHGDYIANDNTPPTSNYDEACKVTVGEPGYGKIKKNNVYGLASGTAYGDGYYPVVAELKGSRILSLTIVFSEESEHDIYDQREDLNEDDHD